MDEHLVLAFALAVALLSILPGPDMMYIVSNAAAGGRRAGVVAALGMSTALAVHTIAAALGLTALLAAAPAALEAVRWAGAVVLVYLAITTWRHSRQPLGTPPPSQAFALQRSLPRTYAMAVLTDLANPKVILFYLAFVPQFIAPGSNNWPVASQLLMLGVVFILIGLAVDASVGVLAGLVSERLLRRRQGQAWLQRTSSLIYGGLAAVIVADNR